MKLTIILPFFNNENTLADQLDALVIQQWAEPWELIAVDNGSTDRSLEIALSFQDKYPHYRVIDASEKRGASFARNKGVRSAQAELLAFCDADDVVAPGWVAAIGEALATYPFVASRFDYEKLNRKQGQDYIRGNQETGLQQLWYPPYAYHTGGCGMGVRKELHKAVGGFNESLPRLQDTDFCLRIQQKGVTLTFVKDALIYIRNRPDRQGAYFQGRTWAKYNTLLYKKYGDEQKIPNYWKKYFRDWYLLCKRGLRRGVTSQWAFQFGWQIGLLQGILTYHSRPAVVTSYRPPTANNSRLLLKQTSFDG